MKSTLARLVGGGTTAFALAAVCVIGNQAAPSQAADPTYLPSLKNVLTGDSLSTAEGVIVAPASGGLDQLWFGSGNGDLNSYSGFIFTQDPNGSYQCLWGQTGDVGIDICWHNDPNLQWTTRPAANGLPGIVIVNQGSPKCLATKQLKPTVVGLETCNDGPNQRWIYTYQPPPPAVTDNADGFSPSR